MKLAIAFSKQKLSGGLLVVSMFPCPIKDHIID
jgi:hypothetical protein